MDRKQRLINTSPNNKPRWFQIHWKWSTKFTSLSINHPTAWICSCTPSASLNGPLMKISTTRESSPMNIYNVNNILYAQVSEITLKSKDSKVKYYFKVVRSKKTKVHKHQSRNRLRWPISEGEDTHQSWNRLR